MKAQALAAQVWSLGMLLLACRHGCYPLRQHTDNFWQLLQVLEGPEMIKLTQHAR